MIAEIQWNAVIAIGTVVVAVPTVSGFVASAVTHWRNTHKSVDERSDRLWIAVFGRRAEPPYDEIPGLVATVPKIERRVAKLETTTDGIRATVQTLHPNGGESVADHIQEVVDYVREQKEGGESHGRAS